MRVLIVSDLHANLEAVRSLPSEYDELWVLGDLVNYGPNPCEVIEFARANASLIIRGNHDHSAGYDDDPKCSSGFRRMAEETGRYTKALISEDQRGFLRSLPLIAERTIGGVRFLLCHATPADPLHEYQRDPVWWEGELARTTADVLLVGHTHRPFCRRSGGRVAANPGSVGQPKHGVPQACYGVWDDGGLRLESAEYPVEETIAKVRALPLPAEVSADLITVLRTGSDKTLQ